MSWLINLKELKEKSNKTIKQIAEGTKQPERTIIRILRGETENPTVTTLIPIINFLGGSLDEIFADTKTVIGTETLVELKENVELAQAEKELLIAEINVLKDKVNALTSENKLLNLKLSFKEELLAVHNYYNKIKPE